MQLWLSKIIKKSWLCCENDWTLLRVSGIVASPLVLSVLTISVWVFQFLITFQKHAGRWTCFLYIYCISYMWLIHGVFLLSIQCFWEWKNEIMFLNNKIKIFRFPSSIWDLWFFHMTHWNDSYKAVMQNTESLFSGEMTGVRAGGTGNVRIILQLSLCLCVETQRTTA